MRRKMKTGYIATMFAVGAMLLFSFVSCSVKSVSVDPKYLDHIMNSMKKARAGDWALYIAGKKMAVRMQVVEVDDDGITIQYLTYLNASPQMDSSVKRFDFDRVKKNLEEGMDIYGAIEYTKMVSKPETMTFFDMPVKCTKWNIQTSAGYSEVWLSDEIPVFGVARQVRNSKNSLIAWTWGRAGERVDWPPELQPLTSGSPPSSSPEK